MSGPTPRWPRSSAQRCQLVHTDEQNSTRSTAYEQVGGAAATLYGSVIVTKATRPRNESAMPDACPDSAGTRVLLNGSLTFNKISIPLRALPGMRMAVRMAPADIAAKLWMRVELD